MKKNKKDDGIDLHSENLNILKMLGCYKKTKLKPKQLFVLNFIEFPSHHKVTEVSAAKTKKWFEKEYNQQLSTRIYTFKSIKTHNSVLKQALYVLRNKLVVRLREYRIDIYFLNDSKEAANEILSKVIAESKVNHSYGRTTNSFLDDNVD